jgi:hypothetical protein
MQRLQFSFQLFKQLGRQQPARARFRSVRFAIFATGVGAIARPSGSRA